MGNRAVVVFTRDNGYSPSIYLHWNGGPESVYAFLDALDRYEVGTDGDYEAARFVQIVGNFFGGSLSLGISNCKSIQSLDCDDNGVYVVERHGHTTPPDAPGRTRSLRRKHGGRWLSEAEVEHERRSAYAHAYHIGPEPISMEIDARNKDFMRKEDGG